MTTEIFHSKIQKILLLIFLLQCFTTAMAQVGEYRQGVIHVKLMPAAESQFTTLMSDNSTINTYNITQIEQPYRDGDSVISLIYRIHFDAAQSSDSLIHFLTQFPFIDYAEKLPIYKTCYMPNDFNPLHQYALLKVHAQEAWDISKGNPAVVIAVVDNAVRTTHHDLAANIWVNSKEIPNNGIDDDNDGYIDDINGWDVADHDNNPNPPSGINANSYFNHGSHTSGIAAAVTDNASGVASLSFNCSIMAVKCTPDTSNEGNILPNPYDGVYYAVKAHANIINMSFETTTPDKVGQDMINYAYNSGIVCVGAAGNDSSNTYRYPAVYKHVIAVGATDQNDKKCSFSNYGPDVTVMAPGQNILSTMGFNDVSLGYFDGTSMAAPLVCSLAGLILSENPVLNPDQVKYYLMAGCDNIDALNPTYKGALGAGRINAWSTMKLVQQDTAKYTSNAIINLFPNPCANTCNIRFYQRCEAAQFTILLKNILGQPVLQQTVTSFSGFCFPLSLATLPQGLYFAQITLPYDTVNTIIVKAAN